MSGVKPRPPENYLHLHTLMPENLPHTLLKGAVYLHPALAVGFLTLMDHVEPAD